jgi:hypothetical protein
VDDLAEELADEGHAALYFVFKLGMDVGCTQHTLVVEEQSGVDEGRGGFQD